MKGNSAAGTGSLPLTTSEINEIDRRGMHLDDDLTAPRRGIGLLDQARSFDRPELCELDRPHLMHRPRRRAEADRNGRVAAFLDPSHEIALDDLAARRQREFVQQQHYSGMSYLRQAACVEVIQQRLGPHLVRPRACHDREAYLLAEPRIGDGKRRSLATPG